MKRKFLTVTDIFVIGFILILTISASVFVLFGKSGGSVASISIDGEIYKEIALNSNQTEKVVTDNGYNIIEIKNGVCFVSDADCKDKLCKNSGKIKNKGDSIVCLPHKLIVEIK